MKKMMISMVLMVICSGAGCLGEESEEPEVLEAEQIEETFSPLSLEDPNARPDASILAKRRSDVAPAYAPCGTTPRNLENRRINNASSPNAARQRTGSSTGCTALGELQPTDDAVYFCYTDGRDGFTWTYLRNVRTGVRGWVRDDLLRPIGGIRGALTHCGS